MHEERKFTYAPRHKSTVARDKSSTPLASRPRAARAENAPDPNAAGNGPLVNARSTPHSLASTDGVTAPPSVSTTRLTALRALLQRIGTSVGPCHLRQRPRPAAIEVGQVGAGHLTHLARRHTLCASSWLISRRPGLSQSPGRKWQRCPRMRRQTMIPSPLTR